MYLIILTSVRVRKKDILYPELTLYSSLGAGQGEFWEEEMKCLAQKVILQPVR